MSTLPEMSKRPGVLYAYTETGVELPVVDITNPAFALEMDEARWKRRKGWIMAKKKEPKAPAVNPTTGKAKPTKKKSRGK